MPAYISSDSKRFKWRVKCICIIYAIYGIFRRPNGCSGVRLRWILISVFSRKFFRRLIVSQGLATYNIRVAFIPKVGKSFQVFAKDFRPISLSSFLLQTPAHRKQHTERYGIAYSKGMSVDTTLHAVVSWLEAALRHREHEVVFSATELSWRNEAVHVHYERSIEAADKLGLFHL